MRNKSGDLAKTGSVVGRWLLVVDRKNHVSRFPSSVSRWSLRLLSCALVGFLLGAGSILWAGPQGAVPPQLDGGSRATESGEGTAAAARQLFDLLNGERVKAGLAPMAWDDRLAAAAQEHARLMGHENRLAHQLPGELPLQQRLTAVPLNHAGENVAVAGTVAEAHTGLMGSPPHRANILSSEFNAVGIGAIWTGMGLWVVQDFAERIPELSGQAAADLIANAYAQARTEAGQKPLPRTEVENLSRLACDMARHGRADASPVLQLPDAHYAVAYTSLAPGQLPPDMLRVRAVRDVKRFEVGVCFARTASYPSGTYWVLVGFFVH